MALLLGKGVKGVCNWVMVVGKCIMYSLGRW